MAVVACGDDGASPDAGARDVSDESDAEPGDASHDAESDVEEDVGTTADVSLADVFDGGLDVPPPPLWRHEPQMETVDLTPCEEWDYVERVPRGLPADSTPRVLWRYRPALDPLYVGINAQFESHVRNPVVSPDGTIWVQGPRTNHVTQLTAEGRMRRWWVVGGASGTDPKVYTRLSTLTALPDGRVIALVYSRDARFPRGLLLRIDPTRPFSPAARRDGDGRLAIDGLTENTQFAVGPGGMFYVAAGNKLHATCKGERLMWTLTNVSQGDEPEGTGRLFRPMVQADGGLDVSAVERTYHIAPSTTAVEVREPIALAANETMGYLARTATRTLFNIHGGRENRLVLFDGSDVAEFRGVSDGGLSPTLEVRFFRDLEAFVAHPPYEVEESVTLYHQRGPGDLWIEDGDWLRQILDRRGLHRVTGTGEIVWTVDPTPGEEAGLTTLPAVYSEQGVYYGVGTVAGNFVELIAIQTDGLPPPLSTCLIYGCNAHLDRWMRPEEVPAE